MRNLIEKITTENTIASIESMLSEIEGTGPQCMNPMIKFDYTDVDDLKYVVDSDFYSNETQIVLGRVDDLLDYMGVEIDDHGNYTVPGEEHYRDLANQLNDSVIEQIKNLDLDE